MPEIDPDADAPDKKKAAFSDSLKNAISKKLNTGIFTAKFCFHAKCRMWHSL